MAALMLLVPGETTLDLCTDLGSPLFRIGAALFPSCARGRQPGAYSAHWSAAQGLQAVFLCFRSQGILGEEF